MTSIQAIDTNGDLIADAYFQDCDGNGTFETLFLDSDQDGRYDFANQDGDGDGYRETVFTHLDGDGELDYTGTDRDQDGVADPLITPFTTSVPTGYLAPLVDTAEPELDGGYFDVDKDGRDDRYDNNSYNDEWWDKDGDQTDDVRDPDDFDSDVE